MVVPFAAGGNTDMMARLGAQQLSAKFGQTFAAENRPSAGGALGTGVVVVPAPDGYTLPVRRLLDHHLSRRYWQKLKLQSGAATRADHQCRHRYADDRHH